MALGPAAGLPLASGVSRPYRFEPRWGGRWLHWFSRSINRLCILPLTPLKCNTTSFFPPIRQFKSGAICSNFFPPTIASAFSMVSCLPECLTSVIGRPPLWNKPAKSQLSQKAAAHRQNNPRKQLTHGNTKTKQWSNSSFSYLPI
jgi:hypothetical protein